MNDTAVFVAGGFVFLLFVVVVIYAITRSPIHPAELAEQQDREWRTTLLPVVPLQVDPQFEPLSVTVYGLPFDPSEDTYLQRLQRKLAARRELLDDSHGRHHCPHGNVGTLSPAEHKPRHYAVATS